MADLLERADAIACDLVRTLAKLDTLGAVVRIEGSDLRIIAPADFYPALARLFYRAADEMVARCPDMKH